MKDLVTTNSGMITYDWESIEHWLSMAKDTTCLVTKQPMPRDSNLTPNHTLRRLIQSWCVLNASNGVDRIPTPKSPIHRSNIIKLIRNLNIPEFHTQALKKMKDIAEEAEDAKEMVKENVDLIESILWVLSLDMEEKDNHLHVKTDSLLVLKKVVEVLSSTLLEQLKLNFFNVIVTVVREKISLQATKPALQHCNGGEKDFEGSPAVDDKAIHILSLVARFSGTNEVVMEMLRAGAMSKLCMVLQADSEKYLKSKAGEAISPLLLLRYRDASERQREGERARSKFTTTISSTSLPPATATTTGLSTATTNSFVIPVGQFFSHLTLAVNIIGSSPKTNDTFRGIQDAKLTKKLAIENDDDEEEAKEEEEKEEFETSKGKNQIRTFKRVGDMRWGSHFGSISSLMDLFSATCLVLKDIINDPDTTGKQRSKSDGVYDAITSIF
ncbi:hypothetical protein Vadar_031226 [Vaccinium darrowii]|uniref:Uncharacterized protein n=1 Tax=Vaccinium darrowii TaxID=229202 RepID=A0ACB7XDU1_9ERIC|nr:hypothetical protein Vadar_031226 [Vaccinium darrowii]